MIPSYECFNKVNGVIRTSGYEKKISDQHFLKFNLDSTTSTQELTSFSGNFSYKFTF